MAPIATAGKRYKIVGTDIYAWKDYAGPRKNADGTPVDRHARGTSTTSAGPLAIGTIIEVIDIEHRVEEGYPDERQGYSPYEVVKAKRVGDPSGGEFYAWIVYEGVSKIEEYVAPSDGIRGGIYNFIWVVSDSVLQNYSVGLQVINFINTPDVIRGAIVFPAFMTPLVYVKGKDPEWLELLIATEGTITPDNVNRQLKLSPGLKAEKPYSENTLFESAQGNIVVEEAGRVSNDGNTIVTTHSKFAGILHRSFAEALTGKKLTALHRVKIKDSEFDRKLQITKSYSTKESRVLTHYELNDGVATPQNEDAVSGKELGDEMIRDMLDRRFGRSNGDNPIPGRCRYAFPVEGNTVDLSKVDPNRPIQSYHPLVVLAGQASKDYLALGHISDIHVNSRWQILGKSPARVIEYGDGIYEDESPRIGQVLAENNRSFHNVLERVFDGDADVVIVGGDIVDHIRNAYSAARILSNSNTPRQIWGAMDIQGDAYTNVSYPAGLDLVAFYSFIFDSMVRKSKPVFGLTGNHDCYVDAFGISPRLNAEAKVSRTNEGIPADLNLTFYEALLAFGPSGGLLRSASSSFDVAWFDWFHLVLSPFNDWWFKFPKQSLVGLGWGTSEDLVDPRGAQSGGHLPRSDDAISDAQLALLRQAVTVRATHKVTLTTHFTFLSYIETVAMHPGGARTSRGTFRLNANTLGTEDYSQFEMGTFETNRAALMDMLANRQIQCVLTGHSHRRGLHLLGTRGGDVIPADLFDTDPGAGDSFGSDPNDFANAEPAIIVSDSAGPYPRYNRDGEFGGWGSDRPGGTLIKFDPSSGQLSEVSAVTATRRPKPRGAVAMDYVDVSSNGVFANNRLETLWVTGEQDSGAVAPSATPIWYVKVELTRDVWENWGMYIEKLIFAGRHLNNWIRVEASYNSVQEVFEIPAKWTADFRNWLRLVLVPTRFVSIKMNSRVPFISQRYDWQSHWNFEVTVEPITQYRMTSGGLIRKVSYRISRPQREIAITGRDVNWREIPNFDWRMANDPKYGP